MAGSTADIPIGVLLFAGGERRLKGDPGCPGSFPFPVLYQTVEGSYRDLIHGSAAIRDSLCRGAIKLRDKGAAAIVGDCGLMSLYQQEIAESAGVPTVASSLLLLPLLRRMLSPASPIGVLTGHTELLTSRHLQAAGLEDANTILLQGMQEEPHFLRTVIQGQGPQEYALMCADVLSATKKLLTRDPGIRCILLECSNLAVFGHEIRRQFSLPVFDIGTAMYFLYHSVCQTNDKENE